MGGTNSELADQDKNRQSFLINLLLEGTSKLEIVYSTIVMVAQPCGTVLSFVILRTFYTVHVAWTDLVPRLIRANHVDATHEN